MKVRIEYVYEIGGKKINEDSFLIGKNIFAVFDGATSLVEYFDKRGFTGGYLASNISKSIFKNERIGLYELALKANKNIKKQMITNGIDISKKENLWNTSIAAVKIDLKKKKFDWIQISDSLILVIYKNNKYEVLIKDYDHDSETLIMWKKLADKKVKNIRKKLKSQMLKVKMSVNESYGFLNGEDSAIRFLKKGTKKFDDIKHILIFTDGLILPKKDPLSPDNFDKFVEYYLQGGFQKIRNYIKNIQDSDPNCWKYPRTKQYDDMAGISLTFDDD